SAYRTVDAAGRNIAPAGRARNGGSQPNAVIDGVEQVRSRGGDRQGAEARIFPDAARRDGVGDAGILLLAGRLSGRELPPDPVGHPEPGSAQAPKPPATLGE